jgi:hypothetical protein
VILNNRHQAWFFIAAIAIGLALLLALFPPTHAGNANVRLATLPVVFVGLLTPLSLLWFIADLSLPRRPEAPILPSSFQRPPPSLG